MSDTDSSDDQPRDSRGEREFVRRVGIVIGLVAFAGLGLALFLKSITVFLLLFAAILWSIFLRGIAQWVARYTPVPVRLGIGLVLLVLLGLIALMVVLSGPNIVEQANRAADMIPKGIEAAQEWLQNSPLERAVARLPSPEQLMSSEVMSRVTGIFAGALGVFGNSILIFAVGIYIAIAPDQYKRGIVLLFPPSYQTRVKDLLDKTSTQLGWWLAGRIFAMFLIAVLTTVGLYVLGVPLALFIGVLSGILSFVPVVGPIVSSIPAMLMGLLKSPIYVLYVAILYLGIQTLESYFITPMVEKKAVEIPPALLIMTQVLIGLLAGLFGLLLATPLLATFLVIVQYAYMEDVLGEDTESNSGG